MHGAIEARVRDSSGDDITLMLVASVAPAIITYYWCAALQHGAAPVARRAGVAAALAGLLILGIPQAIVSIGDELVGLAFKLTELDVSPAFAWGMVIGGAPFDLLVNFVSFGALAFAAGAVIDQSLRRRLSPLVTLARVGMVLAGLVLLFQLIATGAYFAAMHEMEPTRGDMAKTQLLAVAGWMVGLVVSGFPTVLRSGAELTAAPKAG
jgi:hypothetical protein